MKQSPLRMALLSGWTLTADVGHMQTKSCCQTHVCTYPIFWNLWNHMAGRRVFFYWACRRFSSISSSASFGLRNPLNYWKCSVSVGPRTMIDTTMGMMTTRNPRQDVRVSRCWPCCAEVTKKEAEEVKVAVWFDSISHIQSIKAITSKLARRSTLAESICFPPLIRIARRGEKNNACATIVTWFPHRCVSCSANSEVQPPINRHPAPIPVCAHSMVAHGSPGGCRGAKAWESVIVVQLRQLPICLNKRQQPGEQSARARRLNLKTSSNPACYLMARHPSNGMHSHALPFPIAQCQSNDF